MIYRPSETGSLDLDPARNPLDDLPPLVAEIVETMRRGNLAELEIVRGDFRLALRAFPSQQRGLSAGHLDRSDEEPPDSDDVGDSANIHIVTSPMIGTFYVAPAPGEPPYEQPGDYVVEDQVVGNVEAMKIMNEISTDRTSTMLDEVAENGQTVEYGSPLVRIRLQP
jgi:acetyl-CoA carboxylase biotin carboxyl carrier protein